MSDRIVCFMLEPTGLYQRSLRRFDFSAGKAPPCAASGLGYHDASVILDELEPAEGHVVSGDLWPHDDPRWPTHCACGYEFEPADEWQLNHDELYRRLDTGELMTWRAAPGGAMRYCDWYIEGLDPAKTGPGSYRGPDGHSLIVKTPAGEWCIDGRSSNGPGWTRTGTPPRVTARPSIAIGDPVRYHAWLTDGVLIPC